MSRVKDHMEWVSERESRFRILMLKEKIDSYKSLIDYLSTRGSSQEIALASELVIHKDIPSIRRRLVDIGTAKDCYTYARFSIKKIQSAATKPDRYVVKNFITDNEGSAQIAGFDLQQKVIERDAEGAYCYLFARDVNGSDIGLLKKAYIRLRKKTEDDEFQFIYNSNFHEIKRLISGELDDLSLVNEHLIQEYILEVGNNEDLVDFAKYAKKPDIESIQERVFDCGSPRQLANLYSIEGSNKDEIVSRIIERKCERLFFLFYPYARSDHALEIEKNILPELEIYQAIDLIRHENIIDYRLYEDFFVERINEVDEYIKNVIYDSDRRRIRFYNRLGLIKDKPFSYSAIELDLEVLNNVLSDSNKSSFLCYNIAHHVSSSDKNSLLNELILRRDFHYLKLFAKNVHGVNLSEIQKVFIDYGGVAELYWFAKEFEECDIVKIQCRFMELASDEQMKRFFKGIKRADRALTRK